MASANETRYENKFLPDVSIQGEQNKEIDITDAVCKLQTKITKTTIFGIANSRHAKFPKFYRIVNMDVINKS